MKPNTINLRDPETNDPITEVWPGGKPFDVFGEKVSQDSPLLMIGLTQDDTRVFFEFLNVEDGKPGEEPGFGELLNPRPGEGPWFVGVAGADPVGPVDFVVYDIPTAKQARRGKPAKLVREFSVTFT